MSLWEIWALRLPLRMSRLHSHLSEKFRKFSLCRVFLFMWSTIFWRPQRKSILISLNLGSIMVYHNNPLSNYALKQPSVTMFTCIQHAYRVNLKKYTHTYCEKECVDCQDLKNWSKRPDILFLTLCWYQINHCCLDKNDFILYGTLWYCEERLAGVDPKARVSSITDLAKSPL